MSETVAYAGAAVSAPRTARFLPIMLTMIVRCLRLTSRNVDALIMGLALPIMLLLLFVYLFGGAIQTGTAYVTYVVPGVLLLCAGFGASLTAVSVNHDMTGGIIDRFRSLDVGGAAFLAGHVVASVARNIISTILVFGVAALIGFRPQAGLPRMLAAAAVLILFVVTLSWLSAVIGLVARNPEAASGFTFFVSFLPYPSSAFVPIETMPWWLQGIARYQPTTPVIESIRALILGTPLGTSLWQALAWCCGLLIVAIVLSSILFQRKTA